MYCGGFMYVCNATDVVKAIKSYTYIHNITPVFPEGLGRGVPMDTHSSPACQGPM